MILIVMRLADMHRVHPDQDTSRVCAECGEQVGIYPSGQRVLRDDPTTRIVCNRCGEPVGGIVILAPGAEREPFESKPR
jgi:DNA-directed RNA polymerase subunit RPC12/RpoP